MKLDGYVVGAYALSSAHQNWDPQSEAELFELLAVDKRIVALELPWIGGLHPHDKDWLLENYPSHWGAVITDIPFAMQRLSQDQTYGLASSDDAGRSIALADVAKLLLETKIMNDALGRKAANVVELHASAAHPFLCKESLKGSLDEIATWDWGETSLVLEHCDAWIASQKPEKGFLGLLEELEVLTEVSANIGVSLNWGRSVIELRDPDRFNDHVEMARDSGLLRGVIFSGTSDRNTEFGPAWIDAHHHVQESTAAPLSDVHSLLTEGRIPSALANAGPLDWSGIKVGWPSSIPGTNSDRVEMVSRSLDVLDRSRLPMAKAEEVFPA